MKWYFKVILFFGILFIIVQALSIIFIPNISNLGQFGFYKKGQYELLDEKNDTVDAVFIGDSLIYSSIIPMHIWNEHGFTTFDCSLPAQALDNSYDYLEVAIESQHPKVVTIEADVVFRALKSRAKTKNEIKALKNWVPILKFHNNWKQFGSDGFINIYKGYKINVKAVPVTNFKPVEVTDKYVQIREENMKIFDKIAKACEDNNAKLILIDVPNHQNFNMVRHNTIQKLADDYNLEFLDLNLEEVGIDWQTDTKDGGEHMNFNGAKKVSTFVGNYLDKLNVLEDHRNDDKYKDWHKAYKLYVERSIDQSND